RQTSRLFRRSAMSTRGRQKRRYGASYDLAHGQPADRGVSPQLPYNVARDLEGDRHRGFGDHRRRRDRLSLFEIAIGLTPRQTKIARQRDSRFHHAGPPREQLLRRPYPLGSLRLGRSRHMTQSYYYLRRKSSTDPERQSTMVRSKRKLPFAFRECSRLPALDVRQLREM